MKFKVIVILLLFINFCIAQFSKSEFLAKVNDIYFSLENSGLTNFVCQVTSDGFEEKSKEIFNKEFSPLQLIWIQPNRFLFVSNTLPSISDTQKSGVIEQLQLELKKELQGLLLDWNRFIGRGLLSNLPEDYKINIRQDTVLIKYQTMEGPENIEVNTYFGMNGLCFKICLFYLNKDKKIYLYPEFQYIEDKWLCNEWTVQIVENAEIASGLNVKINSQKIRNNWLPATLHLYIQSKNIPDKIFRKVYTFSNILINQELRLLK